MNKPNLFYHHVGQLGGDVDFPKTIYKALPTSFVDDNVPSDHPYKRQLIDELNRKFPNIYFNCWGVPSGASFVIKNLSPGDFVLLVENVSYPGSIIALCETKVFINHEFSSLSKALWGSPKYPYVFFFDTELVDFTWHEFLGEIGYKSEYNPRGQFLRVGDQHLMKYGGSEGYVEYLRKKYRMRAFLYKTLIDEKIHTELKDAGSDYITEVKGEFEKIKEASLVDIPTLKEETGKKQVQITTTPRSNAFRMGIRALYDNSCAVCGLKLISPDGIPEVDSAHIYPKSQDGSDDLRNGICLCKFHHWAFDSGWFSIADDLSILVRDNIPTGSGYDQIRDYKERKISLPLEKEYQPHPLFLSEHRKLHGF